MPIATEPFLPKAETYVPTDPELYKIQFADGNFNSCLKTQKAFPAGTVLTPITRTTPAPIPRYSSVQVAPYPALPASAEGASEAWPEEAHIELNTDLLYVNHSCDPNVAFEVPPGGTDGWEVRALKDLAEGEIMTFAYWTTEWDMDQPFDCLCGTARCVGRVTGAKDMKESVLATYPLNKHIVLQKKAQLGLGADQALGGDRAE